MSTFAAAERQQASTLEALARKLAALCNRARSPYDEREQIIDLLVTLGFDDSDDPDGTLAAIEQGQRVRR